MAILIPIAFLAGIVTALSPCVLPVLPVVMAGAVDGGRRRPIGVVIGFAVTLVLFTLALTSALARLGLSATAQRNLGVVVLVGFALTMIVPALGDLVTRALAPLARLGHRLPNGGTGFWGGVLMGMGLGLVWAPCAGPVFSAIAAANATKVVDAGTWLVMTVYAVGAALPMLAIMLGGRRIARRITPNAHAIRTGMGVLLAGVGVLIFTGLDTRFTAWVVDAVPGYTESLQAAERTGAARQALDDLQRRSGAAQILPQPTSRPASQLPVLGDAPEFGGITDWFNADGLPRSLGRLRGKVVLVDFWTYSCVNCIRTIPHLRALDQRYRRDGLMIVGVHTPEFAFERDPGNVRQAIRDLGVTWPVALDPDYVTWNRWGNQYWPAEYLVDQDGKVRAAKFGEGQYAKTEDEIRGLLAERGARARTSPDTAPDGRNPLTPETYLGAARMERNDSTPTVRGGTAAAYRAPGELPPDHVAFSGQATVRNEYVTAGRDFAIQLRFRARRVFLVLGGAGGTRVGQVLLDGVPIPRSLAGADVGADGRVRIVEHRLYQLADLGRSRTGTLTVRLPPGTTAYAFTFG